MSDILVTEALDALGIENYKLEGNPTSEAEFKKSFVKITGSDSDGVATESTDPSKFGVTWSQITTKQKALETEKPLNELRAERNIKLAETDWTAMSDVTMADNMKTYRQALRDLPTHKNWPNLEDADWPTKP